MLQVQGLSKQQLKEIAVDSGFLIRRSRKISPDDLLALICLESQNGSPSYNDLVARFDTMCNVTISKQGFCKRINPACVRFFQAILAHLITTKITHQQTHAITACDKYQRVIIQDSTIIKLPQRLFTVFSGVSNMHASVCNARIQGVYELLSGRFLQFSIDPYSKNDFIAAPALKLRRDDLVLRDRGYFTSGEIKRHLDTGADCIYRHKQKMAYLDPVDARPIQLMVLLERHGNLDMVVCLNNPERTRVRLLAAPVSQQLANDRRRKAKKEMKGHNPPKELLKLMGWTIFITTIPRSEADFDRIMKIYSFRWQIEIIFKTWKSHLNFAKVHNVSAMQLSVLLTARLIMIVVVTHGLFAPICMKISRIYNRNISMMKFMHYIRQNPEKIPALLDNIQMNSNQRDKDFELVIKYCAYDKRQRPNLKLLATKILLG
ncbi:MAG: IS4 family transposase [Bacteroidota bacterium]